MTINLHHLLPSSPFPYMGTPALQQFIFSAATGASRSPWCCRLVCIRLHQTCELHESIYRFLFKAQGLRLPTGNKILAVWPAMVSLASRWEADPIVHQLVRESAQGHLVRWTKPSLAGVASCEQAKPNIAVLSHLSDWWAQQMPLPQTIPINVCRKEASCLKVKIRA